MKKSKKKPSPRARDKAGELHRPKAIVRDMPGSQGDDQMAFFEAALGADAVAAIPCVESVSETAAIAAEETRSGTTPQQRQDPIAPLVESLAQRLVAARDARGWTRERIACELRLPLHIVQWIETDQYGRIGQGVYLRGYLTNYARLVGVPVEAVEEWLRAEAPPPPELIATGQIARSRYLLERYSGSALYLVLTGVIFVPLVMFAMNMGGNAGSRLTPLDAPVPALNAAQSDALPASPSSTAQTKVADAPIASPPSTAASYADSPVMASFAVAPAVSADSVKQAVAPGEPLRLSIGEASWVEIVDADGKRLEYATLPAGTVKDYPAGKSLTVLIGNTNGAKVDVDGRAQDIAPYTRGNVARFKLVAGSPSIAAAAEPHIVLEPVQSPLN